MERYWDRFIEAYVNDPFYWSQPKGTAISPGNVEGIQKKLHLLQSFQGKPWKSIQFAYTKTMQGSGLIAPRRATPRSQDYAAIARMNKKVFDSLGVAWTTDRSIVQITEAGEEFVRTVPKRIPAFVQRQLCRYEFPNPSIGPTIEGAGVFPYLALLAVLTHFDGGIPTACYELFIARIRGEPGVQAAVDRIRRYLRLAPADRERLVERLDQVPLLKAGKIRLVPRRSSLLNTIRLNRPFMLSFLKTPGLVVEAHKELGIPPEARPDAEALVQEHLRRDCYIRFATEEDWVAFYGQPGKRPSFEEALLYYSRRGEIQQATDIFRRAKARRTLPKEMQTLGEAEFRELHVLEKTLEDFLEFNLGLLEDGLVFVQRQYPTASGPLDILARDRRRRWVVIELKRGRAADRVIGQLLRYRAFIVSERAKGRDQLVRGFVVAPQPDRTLVEAARGAPTVPLEVFQFTVKGQARRMYPK
jgi:hypothetical protein